jgi:hypothetical protein
MIVAVSDHRLWTIDHRLDLCVHVFGCSCVRVSNRGLFMLIVESSTGTLAGDQRPETEPARECGRVHPDRLCPYRDRRPTHIIFKTTNASNNIGRNASEYVIRVYSFARMVNNELNSSIHVNGIFMVWIVSGISNE